MTVIGILSSKHFLWCIFCGIIIACVYAYYVRGVLGRLVRALIQNEAFDEETALTPAELGLSGFAYKFALRKKSNFREHIKVVGKEKRCYVEPEKVEKLSKKYGENDMGITSLLLTLCAFLLVGCIIAAVLPEIELLIKGLVS